MAVSRRLWLVDLRKVNIVNGRLFAIIFRCDYDSMLFSLHLGWFGFTASYLMPSPFTLAIESSWFFGWDPPTPIREGMSCYRKTRDWRHVHKTSAEEFEKWCRP